MLKELGSMFAATDPREARVLKKVRVLDLTRFLSGPTSTLFLAGLGAEVIRIDEPSSGDPTAAAPPFFGPKGVSLHRQTPDDLGIAYLKRARGKKSVTIDLKKERGLALFHQLVSQSDVVVENFRVGVTERLGIDFETLKKINPQLIYCSITGYGATGPDRHLKAYDLMVQAATGLMSITGDPDGHACKTGSSLSDGIAGTFAVIGVLGALLQRQRTGKGQFIDVSMTDCLLSLMMDEPLDCYKQLGLALRQGNHIMRLSPFNTYQTRDDAIAIGVATAQDWKALLEVMGRSDLLNSEQFMTLSWRVENNGEIDALVSAWTRKLSSKEALDQLTARDIACSPIRDARDVHVWSQLQERKTLQSISHPGIPGKAGPLAPMFPLKFSDARTDYETTAAFHAEHTAEVLREIGYSAAEIESLKLDGVI